MNWSTFSHKVSQSGHGSNQETFTCASSLNQGGGGGTGLYNKSAKVEDESNQSPFESGLPLQQIKYC